MSESPPSKPGGWLVLLTAAILVLIFWCVWMALSLQQWRRDEVASGGYLTRFGQIGDTFGSLNTLFSGLAIAGVVFTLYRQHRDSLEADLRHAKDLTIQRNIGRVAMLASSIDYWVHSTKEIEQELEDYFRLFGYFQLLGDNIGLERFFSEAMFQNARHGLEFMTLAEKLVGAVRDEQWKHVGPRIVNRFHQRVPELKQQRETTKLRIEEAIREADLLTASVG